MRRRETICLNVATFLRIVYVCVVSLLDASFVFRLRQFCGHLYKMCFTCVWFYIIIQLNNTSKNGLFLQVCVTEISCLAEKYFKTIFYSAKFTLRQQQKNKNKTNIRRTHKHPAHAHGLPKNMRFIYDFIIFLWFFSSFFFVLLHFFSSFCCNLIFAFASDKQNEHRDELMEDLM